MVKEEYKCDICRKKILNKTSINSLKLAVQTQGIWHRYAREYEHVCSVCQDAINTFITKELFKEKKPTFHTPSKVVNPVKRKKK